MGFSERLRKWRNLNQVRRPPEPFRSVLEDRPTRRQRVEIFAQLSVSVDWQALERPGNRLDARAVVHAVGRARQVETERFSERIYRDGCVHFLQWPALVMNLAAQQSALARARVHAIPLRKPGVE